MAVVKNRIEIIVVESDEQWRVTHQMTNSIFNGLDFGWLEVENRNMSKLRRLEPFRIPSTWKFLIQFFLVNSKASVQSYFYFLRFFSSIVEFQRIFESTVLEKKWSSSNKSSLESCFGDFFILLRVRMLKKSRKIEWKIQKVLINSAKKLSKLQ